LNDTITSAELADVLKITARRVNQLVDENVIVRESDGKFNVADSVERYFENKYKSAAGTDYDLEHALLERAKRGKAEIDLAVMKSKLLWADEVEQLVAGMIITFKARLLSLPTKCAPMVLGQKSMPSIVEILNNAVYEALSELHEVPASVVITASEKEALN
jgi:hypothetical protein